jgi:hypothetical protein
MAEGRLEVLQTRADVESKLLELVESAESGLTVALPYERLDLIAEQLRTAYDRDLLVLGLVYGEGVPDESPSEQFDGLATAVRYIPHGVPPLVVTADLERGLRGHWKMLTAAPEDRQATYFESENLAYEVSNAFLGNFWTNGEELYVRDWSTLPTTHTDFRGATVQAALLLQDDVTVWVRATGYPVDGERTETTVEGRLVNVRQNIVYPVTSGFAAEESLWTETTDGVVSLGGGGAVLETYECFEVTLTDSDPAGR